MHLPVYVGEALAQRSRAMGQRTGILGCRAQRAGPALAGSAGGEGRRIPSLSHVRLMEIPRYGATVKVQYGTPPRYPTSRPRVWEETDRRATEGGSACRVQVFINLRSRDKGADDGVRVYGLRR